MRSTPLVWALWVGLTPLLMSAPAPFPKPPKAPEKLTARSLNGEWRMEWAGVPCLARFTKDGGYSCLFAGALWIGGWHFDKEGRIEVTERLPGSDVELTWHVVIDLPRSATSLKGKAVGEWGSVTLEMGKAAHE